MMRSARQARRSAELHRQHRRAGRRRRSRLPLPRKEDPRRRAGAARGPRRALRLSTAGTSTRTRRRYYKDHPESLPWRSATLHAIEAGEGEVAELAHLVADAIVKAHLATMLRLDVEYDVLPRESEILHLKFWASAFELLKDRKAIYFETEGKNSGCWVMPGLSEEGKVIVRSDGTVTYVGKDIAYQLWKFGLLGKDFYYRPLQTYADGRVLWVTTDEPAAAGARVRPWHAGLQRDRRAPIVFAGRRGRRTARLGLQPAGRPIRPLQLRDGGALPALLRRPRHSAVRGGPQAPLRGSLRPQGTRRQGRRPDGQPDRQSARRGEFPPPRRPAGQTISTWPPRSPSRRCAISC